VENLQAELRLTAKVVGEKALKTKGLSETVLTQLLDQYSERLVSMIDEKMKLNSPRPATEDAVDLMRQESKDSSSSS
jgi:hypothetical protein